MGLAGVLWYLLGFWLEYGAWDVVGCGVEIAAVWDRFSDVLDGEGDGFGERKGWEVVPTGY